MQITLAPMRSDETLEAARRGDVLVLNGEAVDLAAGQTSRWIVGQPQKKRRVWSVTLILPHSPDAPDETLFPKPVKVPGMARSTCRPGPRPRLRTRHRAAVPRQAIDSV